jgi:AraC-like DNA-binding protein
MLFKTIIPAPHIQDFVKDYTIFYFDMKEDNVELVKPFPATNQHSLVFYLQGGVDAHNCNSQKNIRFPTVSINGSQTFRLNFSLDKQFHMLSVNFRTGALSKFLQTHLHEFTDKRLDALDVLGNNILQVYEKISSAKTNENAIEIVEDYLWRKINQLNLKCQPIDNVIKQLFNLELVPSITELAKLSCLSISQFERSFTQINGISPKFYLKISRFNKAYEYKERYPHLDWLSIAIQFGYSDYQHLVKDFKQFANTVPNTLIKEQLTSPERILFSA